MKIAENFQHFTKNLVNGLIPRQEIFTYASKTGYFGYCKVDQCLKALLFNLATRSLDQTYDLRNSYIEKKEKSPQFFL